MKRILCVASREFVATVMTKGFLFGMLFTPALIGLMIFLIPRLLSKGPPKIEGQVAIIDPTGAVAGSLASYLSPQEFAERRAQTQRQLGNIAIQAARRQASSDLAIKKSLDAALGQVPQLSVVSLAPGTDIEQEKIPLKSELPKQTGSPSARLALIVVHPDAVRPANGKDTLGTYDLFIRSKLDDRLLDDIHAGLRQAIVSARLQVSGLDLKRINALTSVRRPQSRTVTAEGERTTNVVFNMLLPAAFMILLWMSVLSSGQSLLTSTVEEKSNRVVEILLSAVSAMELMTGKILGHMAVGFLILALYLGIGLLALVTFATLGLLDMTLLIFLLIFYLLAYFTIAAMMAAIGSAVSEMREAQSLMTPVMLVLIIPWLLWLPISRDPNSLFAVVLSFLPPFGNFVMLLRMTSNAPPAMWQVWVSILISAAGVYAALWFAAKVFRIGLLMFGKPPTLGTLVRWARMS